MNVLGAALVSGFLIGLIGNIHCIAMCGPLALSLPTYTFTKKQRIFTILLYNGGRTVSYSILGLIFGLIGNSISLFGLQQILSIGAGLLLLLLSFSKISNDFKIPLFTQIKFFIQNLLIKKLQQTSNPISFLTIGILNGFLPCGLVYIASTTALAFGNLFDSIVVMFSFGLGTFPLMFALMFIGNKMSFAARNRLKKTTPILVSFVALLLILRGLNLNIPFVSPYLNTSTSANTVSCH